jgi:ATP-dependent Clp protease ATP-binding subunit ClpX
MQLTTPTPSKIVAALDRHVIGQEDAKRIVAVAVYAHFRKVALAAADGRPIIKSNVLLIGNSGTGKTLLCETLSRVLDVPFVTAEATSLAQTRFVNEEIDAILQRLVERAGGDLDLAARGIVFIDEIDKLKSAKGVVQATSGESVQHALLKIMEGAAVQLADGRFVDTTNTLFVCGGAFVGLSEIISQTHGYGFIATGHSENRKILDRLNSRVKPTDLFTYGLIPEFTGRLPVIARFHDLTREMLVRIMTEPEYSLLTQFRELFASEGVELVVEPHVFEQIAEVSMEYKTGARSLRGIFEELISPVLYAVPDRPDVAKVVIRSLFADAEFVAGPRRTLVNANR